jgi:hypothetical protein
MAEKAESSEEGGGARRGDRGRAAEAHRSERIAPDSALERIRSENRAVRPRTVRFNKKQADRKRATNAIYDALLHVEIEDAIGVLEYVTEEFRRAQQEPDALSADAFKHKSMESKS